MKIIITEEQKKNLFVPRNIDERKSQLKTMLVNKTKDILSRFNITKIVNHGRIDDYDERIDAEEHITEGYETVIIDGKNYYGFPTLDETDEQYMYDWEEILATYLNSLIPQSPSEEISRSVPSINGRMYKVIITPESIDISFSYNVIKYKNNKGSETINL